MISSTVVARLTKLSVDAQDLVTAAAVAGQRCELAFAAAEAIAGCEPAPKWKRSSGPTTARTQNQSLSGALGSRPVTPIAPTPARPPLHRKRGSLIEAPVGRHRRRFRAEARGSLCRSCLEFNYRFAV